MPPRKRDKEIESKKQETKPDQELFIQAYESKWFMFSIISIDQLLIHSHIHDCHT